MDNTNQIIFPAEFGSLRGRIAPSVQDSPSTYTIYARRKNGAYMDITGQTPTAKFTRTTAGGSVYTSTGTFTVTDGEAGEFTWLPSAADLGIDGSYYLQFTIDGERSEDRLRWVIQERLDSSGSVTPTAMAALSADELALVTALESALPAAEGDIFKYTGGAWTTTAESGGGGAVDSVFGRAGAVVPASGDYGTDEISDDSVYAKASLTGALDSIANDIGGLDTSLNTHIGETTDVHGIADTSILLDTSDIGSSVQAYSAKTAAIAALTWAANSIILLTGTATASVQALAAHVVTLLQSATAADARSAIGAGTGDGDVTGPGSSVDNTIPRFDSTTGKILQTTTAVIDDSGNITMATGAASTTSRVLTFIGSTGTTLGYIDVAAGILRFVGVTKTAIFADNAEVIRVDNTGRVGIKKTVPDAMLDIDQGSAAGAIPVLKLDQADVSEEFIRFVGTSADGVLTQSIVEAADVATPTIAGYVKIFIQDDGNQLTDQAYFLPVYTLA